MKKNTKNSKLTTHYSLLTILLILITSTVINAQRQRLIQIDADTTTRPATGMHGIAVKSGHLYTIPFSGTTKRILSANTHVGTSGQFLSTNGTVNTWATITKSTVGLSNVDNTSDVAKPLSTAVTTALNLKSNIANPTFSGKITTPDILVSNLTPSQLVGTDASDNLVSLSTATYPSLAELAFTKGLTSNAQTQINARFTLPSLTSGSVLFYDGTTIAQNNAQFFLDNTNNRFGIGTATPLAKLHVSGGGISIDSYSIPSSGQSLEMGYLSTYGQINSYNRTASAFTQLRIDGLTTVINSGSNGNVGIGTTSPTLAKLQVNGAIYQQGADASGVGIYTNGALRFLSNTNFIDFNNSGAANSVSFRNGSGVRTDLFISATGNIGVGSTSPTLAKIVSNDAAKAQLLIQGFATHAVSQSSSNGEINIGSASAFQGRIGYDGQNNANLRFTNTYSISDNVNGGFDFVNGTNRLMRISSNGSVGIGTNTVVASSILELVSTTKGVLLPRMTTTQINAITSPANGLMVYNTTLNKLCVYENTAWRQVSTTAM